MPLHNDNTNEPGAMHNATQPPIYRAPRIDTEFLTIVVRPSPYSKRTPLGRSKKATLRRRWFS
jgi:hypothetical protein